MVLYEAQKFLILIKSSLYINLAARACGIITDFLISHLTLLNPRSRGFTIMFSSRNLTVLALTFRLLIHLELIFFIGRLLKKILFIYF